MFVVVRRPLRDLVDNPRELTEALKVLLRELRVELLCGGLLIQRSPLFVARYVCSSRPVHAFEHRRNVDRGVV